MPQNEAAQATTRSPGRTVVTCSPTLSTIPAASCPRTTGSIRARGESPRWASRSE
jgi:hypothetical protein